MLVYLGHIKIKQCYVIIIFKNLIVGYFFRFDYPINKLEAQKVRNNFIYIIFLIGDVIARTLGK